MNFELWMKEVRNLGWKPGLSRIKSLLNRLDNPQNKLDIIHITGTNGKGSTATLLHNILVKGNYKVGQFSSPSILGFHHMYLINHMPITEERLNEIGKTLKLVIENMIEEGEEHPTEYEILAAAMYQYFFEEHVDFAVVEVAMGGEKDCTNVMDYSIQSIITPISMDHTDFLGDTLAKIAIEKSGVIKNNSVLISHKQEDEVIQVLKNVCEQKQTVIRIIDTDETPNYRNPYQVFHYKGLEIQSKLLGKHQMKNICVVIEAVHDLMTRGYASMTTEALLEAIKETTFEGRFEQYENYILDGAHNNESLKALAETLKFVDSKKRKVILGVLGDKDINEGLIALKPFVESFILTEPNSPRKLDVKLLKEKVEQLGIDVSLCTTNYEEALKAAGTSALICGSFYLIQELRPKLIQ
ncbi:MAG: hypothetical protein JXR88_05715 [Clostridia bacterium]|nr:hypothetical protein [Clostridia bacterium]